MNIVINNDKIVTQAQVVLDAYGISLESAITMALTQIVNTQQIPFNLTYLAKDKNLTLDVQNAVIPKKYEEEIDLFPFSFGETPEVVDTPVLADIPELKTETHNTNENLVNERPVPFGVGYEYIGSGFANAVATVLDDSINELTRDQSQVVSKKQQNNAEQNKQGEPQEAEHIPLTQDDVDAVHAVRDNIAAAKKINEEKQHATIKVERKKIGDVTPPKKIKDHEEKLSYTEDEILEIISRAGDEPAK